MIKSALENASRYLGCGGAVADLLGEERARVHEERRRVAHFVRAPCGKLDIRLPEKGNSNSCGARPVH